ncbi:MAG: ATP-dependent DNA helicase RecQ, partial [Sphingobacteriales bacterium]
YGYTAFRPLQEDIITSVLEGKDTLALLPTGGGKSVCFQVPALAMEGLCIVVSPLIALMKDQVEQLQKRGIKAISISSGMHRREIDIALDNCVHGDVKFLYVSPERLKTDIFLARFRQMKVCLIAVDEAHCISAWGYDFRPPYLQIALIRALQPKIPVIALTATATDEVKKDICERLEFKTGYQVFQQSFARKNLSYSCLETEDKPARLLQILKNVPGTAIVYVRSRNRTSVVAQWLQKQGLQAAHYHAGLSPEQRNTAQNNWIHNKTRIIVATNAFGMGIDKPDVRAVVHLDLPANLEAYYQEAGRAGRDERYSYAVLLYCKNDLEELQERIEQEHPPITELKRVYQALANSYQLAVGSGELQAFPFSLEEFSAAYKFNPAEAHNALKKLETEGLIQLNPAYHSP